MANITLKDLAAQVAGLEGILAEVVVKSDLSALVGRLDALSTKVDGVEKAFAAEVKKLECKISLFEVPKLKRPTGISPKEHFGAEKVRILKPKQPEKG